jgi:hypothetical protein
MTARPGKASVTWTDGIGLMQRELDVARACNRCDCTGRVRLDKSGGLMPPRVYGEPLYVPVECGACGWWYAVEARYAPPHVLVEPAVLRVGLPERPAPLRVPVPSPLEALQDPDAYDSRIVYDGSVTLEGSWRAPHRSLLERVRDAVAGAWAGWRGAQ